jgi:hypothetical protein
VEDCASDGLAITHDADPIDECPQDAALVAFGGSRGRQIHLFEHGMEFLS